MLKMKSRLLTVLFEGHGSELSIQNNNEHAARQEKRPSIDESHNDDQHAKDEDMDEANNSPTVDDRGYGKETVSPQ